MISARIPFAGFYYSIWDSEIDHWVEQQAEYHGESVEDVSDRMDYGTARLEIAQAYTEAFADWLGETLDKPVTLEFEQMTSPRYYNFETDRIFAKGDVFGDVLAELRSKDADTLAKAFREAFTSRSGFISFYDPVVPSKPIEDWDHNELYVLLEAWIAHQGVESIDHELFEGLSEKISQICDGALKEVATSG
jgi:hypothetical protein